MKSIARKPILRINPKDLKLLNSLTIQRHPYYEYGKKFWEYSIIGPGFELIGKVLIQPGNNYIYDIGIKSQFQKRGVGSFVYDYIEKDLGIRLEPSPELLGPGEKFWERRIS